MNNSTEMVGIIPKKMFHEGYYWSLEKGYLKLTRLCTFFAIALGEKLPTTK
ncbi:MAG: hypothetical protein H0T62_07095 [Parachlamydiaceae bacterium]|nr:hypothetical protein [Parachlamydiaceae bacterium]